MATLVTVTRFEVGPDTERSHVSLLRPGDHAVPTYNNEKTDSTEQCTSNEESAFPKDPEDTEWTTVRHRQAHSLNSLEPIRSHSGNDSAKGLTIDQIKTVKAATNTLTDGQKRAIRERQKSLSHHRRDSVSSRGEGTSKPKSKGIDPREWGNVNISQESLDVETQAAALKSFAPENKTSKQRYEKGSRRTHQSDPGNNQLPSNLLPAESCPVAQLAKNSYLGMALRNVGRPNNGRSRRNRDDSPPPSGSSSSDDESPSSESSSTTSERSRRRRRNRHGRNKRRSKSSSSSAKSVIKPIAPKEYDGSADARAYHHFVRESDACLRDVKEGKRATKDILAIVLSHR